MSHFTTNQHKSTFTMSISIDKSYPIVYSKYMMRNQDSFKIEKGKL